MNQVRRPNLTPLTTAEKTGAYIGEGLSWALNLKSTQVLD